MLFNSLSFLVFFPIVVLINFILPHKVRYLWLLVASYYFYMNWDAKYALLLLFSTGVTYLSGIAIEKAEKIVKTSVRRKRKKIIVAISFGINIGILFFYKYLFFFSESLNLFLGNFDLEIPNPKFTLLLPVGILFMFFKHLAIQWTYIGNK